MPRYLVRFFGARLLTDEAGRRLVRGSRCHEGARVPTSLHLVCIEEVERFVDLAGLLVQLLERFLALVLTSSAPK